MGGSSSKNYFSGSNAPPKKTPGGGAGPGAGSGGGGGGGGAGGGSSSCNITTAATLRSPNPAVVASLTAGDVLDVVAVSVSGVDVLQANNVAGTRAGVVDTPDEQALLDCIALGNVYIAAVTRIAGGAVTVLVTRV